MGVRDGMVRGKRTLKEIIMTTGPAGGLSKPYKGLIPASADTRPETGCQSHTFPDSC